MNYALHRDTLYTAMNIESNRVGVQSYNLATEATEEHLIVGHNLAT